MGTRMRKLSCLALLNLFPTSDINILQYASPILSLCISVIHSEKDSEQTQVSCVFFYNCLFFFLFLKLLFL